MKNRLIEMLNHRIKYYRIKVSHLICFIAISLVFTIGCGSFGTYVVISSGAFTGHILAEDYEYWEDKKSSNEKENK